jgi:dTDP-4-amino-4,6-dideoxygalactose transaminase
VPNNTFFSNYWLSAILIDPAKTVGITREIVRLKLEKSNIESRPLWKPMHLQPVFSEYLLWQYCRRDTFINGLCLPSGSNLTEEDRHRIKSVILSLFS